MISPYAKINKRNFTITAATSRLTSLIVSKPLDDIFELLTSCIP
jgi:hypothetical protein